MVSRAKKKSAQRLNRLRKTAKRLAAYSAAAAATAMTTQDRSTEASEVVWDIPDVTVGTDSVNFFMDAGEAFTATSADSFFGNVPFSTLGRIRLVGHVVGWANDAYIYAPTSNSGFLGTDGTANYVARLGFGASVAATNRFTIGEYPNFIPNNWYASMEQAAGWAIGDRGFAGIKFDLAEGTHYGWAETSKVNDK